MDVAVVSVEVTDVDSYDTVVVAAAACAGGVDGGDGPKSIWSDDDDDDGQGLYKTTSSGGGKKGGKLLCLLAWGRMQRRSTHTAGGLCSHTRLQYFRTQKPWLQFSGTFFVLQIRFHSTSDMFKKSLVRN